MSELSPKERLLKTLAGESVDRPPVICPGGMMNAAIVEVMNWTGHTLPEAHNDSGLMADLALDVSVETGFENLGIPFCMTVEAEVLGSKVDIGTLACEPKISREIYPDSASADFSGADNYLNTGRVDVVTQAAGKLADKHTDIPVLGSLTGPISTAASIVDPIAFLKGLRKDKENSHRVLEQVTGFLSSYARHLVNSGATAISIGDPTATGEILGPKAFEEFALPYLKGLVNAIHEAGAPAIVHICGDISSVKHLLPRIGSDAISTDAMVNLAAFKEEFPGIRVMGNVSTFLLEWGPAEKINRVTSRLVEQGIDIISPACGLSTSTSITHIRALTDAVREGTQ